jgi:HEAT repeat protein
MTAAGEAGVLQSSPEFVRDALGSPDPGIIRSALQSIRAIGDQGDLSRVLPFLDDPVHRWEAIRALATTWDGSATLARRVAGLLPAARAEPDRAAVLETLADLASAEADSALDEFLMQSDQTSKADRLCVLAKTLIAGRLEGAAEELNLLLAQPDPQKNYYDDLPAFRSKVCRSPLAEKELLIWRTKNWENLDRPRRILILYALNLIRSRLSEEDRGILRNEGLVD